MANGKSPSTSDVPVGYESQAPTYRGIRGRALSKTQPYTMEQWLRDQLALYDELSKTWFTDVRNTYQAELQRQTGQQLRGDVRSLGFAMGRRGLESDVTRSGITAQAESQLRGQYGEQYLSNLAAMDQQIQGLIAQGRQNITLNHFDYLRTMSLLKTEYELQKDLIYWQVQLAKSNQPSGWANFFGSLLGAGIGFVASGFNPLGALAGSQLGGSAAGAMQSTPSSLYPGFQSGLSNAWRY